MKHEEFSIGAQFWCGGKRWRCTDIGTRVITAISLEPHEIVTISDDPNDPSKRIEHRQMTDDPSWLVGPPYKVAESVFDEYDIEGCSIEPEDQ